MIILIGFITCILANWGLRYSEDNGFLILVYVVGALIIFLGIVSLFIS